MPPGSFTKDEKNGITDSVIHNSLPTDEGALEHHNIHLIWWLLLFRLANAFAVRTFFQPDEFFQSLEPAWQIAFGRDSGAWITWEWREHLRSSMHPYMFAFMYAVADKLATLLGVDIRTRTAMLLAAPKLLQAVVAAVMDLYIIKIASRGSLKGDRVRLATILLTLLNPWQLFCSTRTLVNSLEAALTAAALYYWPFEIFMSYGQQSKGGTKKALRKALYLAAIATILRAPNVIIWLGLVASSLAYTFHAASAISTTGTKLYTILLEAVPAGLVVLAFSFGIDYSYYGEATFPPLKFLQFNIVQKLAVFYGKNRPDYYLTEGLPLLLTSAIPLVALGIYRSSPLKFLSRRLSASNTADVLAVRNFSFLIISILTILTLSLIPHKEVRFIYPLLPALLSFAAKPLSQVLHTPTRLSRALITVMILFNCGLGYYALQVHQRGVIDVLDYLRGEYERRLPATDWIGSSPDAQPRMSVGFLMPCHSTPWRSHLVYPGIQAWALTCEPPLHMTMEEKERYMDEADVFYDDPGKWLGSNMKPLFKHKGAVDESNVSVTTTREWPEYLVFFEQLLPEMERVLQESDYKNCWRGFNSHFHDDWRRTGDVIVWCLQED